MNVLNLLKKTMRVATLNVRGQLKARQKPLQFVISACGLTDEEACNGIVKQLIEVHHRYKSYAVDSKIHVMDGEDIGTTVIRPAFLSTAQNLKEYETKLVLAPSKAVA